MSGYLQVVVPCWIRPVSFGIYSTVRTLAAHRLRAVVNCNRQYVYVIKGQGQAPISCSFAGPKLICHPKMKEAMDK